MKTMKWLLRREFWENKGSMLWAPVVAGALMITLIGAIIVYGATAGNFNGNTKVTRIHDGDKTTVVSTSSGNVAAEFNAKSADDKQKVAAVVASSYLAISTPLFLMLSVIAFFYCLGALNDERRDRSILFWKSLPVSDVQTVLSKVVTAALVAPLITIAVGTFVSLLLLLIAGIAAAFHGINLFGAVLSNADFYLAPLQLIGMLPVYVLWALPTIGWLLMVSAWAKSKVFLWAVGAPLLTILIIKWADFLLSAGIKIDWLMQHVVARGLLGLIPGSWLLNTAPPQALVNDQNTALMGEVSKQAWMTLAGPNVWIGAIVGAAMIFTAIRLRRWKDEG